MDTRLDLYMLIGVLVALDFAITLLGWRLLTVFTRDHTSISSAQDMEAFKALVKMNMYMAIGIIVIVLIGLAVLAFGMFSGIINLLDFGMITIVFGVFSQVTAKPITRLESMAKTLPVDGSQFADDYEEVKRKWKESLLPDW